MYANNKRLLLERVLLFSRIFETESCELNFQSFAGMIKDGGTNPSTTCKIAAQQLAADSNIVGVVGAMRSSCSKASHQYFRDNGKRDIVTGDECLLRRSNFSLWLSW